MRSTCENKNIKNLKADDLKVKCLNVKKACINDLKSKETYSDILFLNDLNVEIALETSSMANNPSLDVPTCDPDSILSEFTPKFLQKYGVRKDVFDALLIKGYDVLNGKNGLKERTALGRKQLGLPFKGMKLAGSLTFAPWNPVFPSINFQTKVKWNLKCSNTSSYIDGFKPNPSIVSVYIQYGYIDKKTGSCICEMINLGTSQLDPTIDYKPTDNPYNSKNYGEIFSGTQVIDTKIVQLIYEHMSDPMSTGGIQLLFFVENDVQILRLNNCNNEEYPNFDSSVAFESSVNVNVNAL